MRQQSRLPSPGRLKLQILSSSASNARSAVMPPPIGSLKRKNQNDRAGEQSRTHPVPPVSRSNNANTKFGGISGPSRESSLPTSVSSVRPSPISTRNASFSSNSSVGSRSISGQSCRPQSAMSITRSQRPNSTLYRPSTSQEVHAMNSECQGVGQKKRRAQFLSTPKENFGKSSKHRRNESYDTQIDHTSSGESKSYSANVIRNISISTAFSGLSLHEKSQSTPIVDLEPPATPSQIPRPVLDSLTFPSPLESSSPTKSPKKHTPVTPFLNRNSNIRAAPAPAPAPWDTESRLFGMEKAYSHITQQLDSATNDIDSLKSSLTSYKAQGKPSI